MMILLMLWTGSLSSLQHFTRMQRRHMRSRTHRGCGCRGGCSGGGIPLTQEPRQRCVDDVGHGVMQFVLQQLGKVVDRVWVSSQSALKILRPHEMPLRRVSSFLRRQLCLFNRSGSRTAVAWRTSRRTTRGRVQRMRF